jgi:putative hydrolase of the HAD superfamily
VSTAPADALLFDLGGVIIQIDFGRAIAHWATASSRPVATIQSRFSMDDAYCRHERGEIDAKEYFAALRSSLGVDLSDAELIEGWNSIYLGVVPGVMPLLQRLRERIPTYAFTNSNRTHQPVTQRLYAEPLACFHKVFSSCDLGLRKPDREAFEAIAEEIKTPLSRILFFDDTLANVEGARAIGMPAVHVRGLPDIAAAVDWIR